MITIVDLPIAIGYKVILGEKLTQLLQEHLEADAEIPEFIYAATKFVEGHRRMTKDITKTSDELKQWYKKKKNQKYKSYISDFYVSPKKTSVIAVMNCNGELTYCMLYNKNNSGTTNLKKMISSGHHNLTKISFDRITIEDCEPYILEVPYEKNTYFNGEFYMRK